jgi:leucyl aminopeptidase
VEDNDDCLMSLSFLFSDSYVADEIITSRAGVRIRVGNTDAEGRMVMADVLYKITFCCSDISGCI